jgi:hypothetical protein
MTPSLGDQHIASPLYAQDNMNTAKVYKFMIRERSEPTISEIKPHALGLGPERKHAKIL